MKYIPPFIIDNLRSGKPRGHVDAWVLVAELANLERLAAGFEAQGKKGAKEFARLLDAFWLTPLREVERLGGLITSWQGDAVEAIFPQAGPLEAVTALNLIRSAFLDSASVCAKQGWPEPRTRLLLGWGRVGWQIFPNKLQHEYTIFGRETDTLGLLPRGRKQVLLSPAATAKLHAAGLLDSRGHPQQGVLSETFSPLQESAATDPALRDLFEHPRFRDLDPAPNFCQVVCSQVKLTWNDPSALDQLIQDMELLAITFGALVRSIHMSGNEYSGVVWFGVPLKDGKAAYRACRAAVEASKKFPGVRHGIASGTVFAGKVGGGDFKRYAVLGEVAERAGQLCALAAPGEVVTDQALRKELSEQFSFRPLHPGIQKDRQFTRAFSLTPMPAPGTARAVFVGRKEELETLRALLKQSLESGKNLFIQINGEPGIGKTRLAEEIMSAVPEGACSILRLWCDPSSPPLEPLRQLFRQLFPLARESERDTGQFSALWKQWAGTNADLLSLESFIGSLLGLQWPESLLELTPPDLRLTRILGSAALTLRVAASRHPLLIHIDDLQWLDPQSRRFFERLGASGIKRTCILATSRYLEDGSAPVLRAARFAPHRLDLGPLNQEDALDLHKALLGVEVLPSATVAAIKKKFNGSPFLVEQMIALSRELGRVNARGEFDLPENWEDYDLNDVLLQRIDHLAAKTRACLSNASVLGMRFNIKVLSRMLNSDARRELAGGTKNHIWKDLGEVLYIFSHVLIQEAAYARVLGKELPRLHLSAARAMENVFELELDEHAAEIARHYEKADEPAKAAHYYDRAADYAWEGSFLDRAEEHYARAIALSVAAEGKNSPNYCEYLFHQALLLHYLLRYREAEPLYLEVARLARRIHGSNSLALSPYLNNLGRFYKDTGRFDEGAKLLRQSLAIERENDPVGSNVADRINNLGHLHGIRKQFDQAEALFLEALEIMEKNYDPWHFFTGTVCGNLGGVYFHQGRLAEARKMLERALEITQKNRGPDHPVTAIYLTNLANVHRSLKHYAKAETLFLKALNNISGPFGEFHPKTLTVVGLLQELSAERGDPAKAKYFAAWLARGKAEGAGK